MHTFIPVVYFVTCTCMRDVGGSLVHGETSQTTAVHRPHVRSALQPAAVRRGISRHSARQQHYDGPHVQNSGRLYVARHERDVQNHLLQHSLRGVDAGRSADRPERTQRASHPSADRVATQACRDAGTEDVQLVARQQRDPGSCHRGPRIHRLSDPGARHPADVVTTVRRRPTVRWTSVLLRSDQQPLGGRQLGG